MKKAESLLKMTEIFEAYAFYGVNPNTLQSLASDPSIFTGAIKQFKSLLHGSKTLLQQNWKQMEEAFQGQNLIKLNNIRSLFWRGQIGQESAVNDMQKIVNYGQNLYAMLLKDAEGGSVANLAVELDSKYLNALKEQLNIAKNNMPQMNDPMDSIDSEVPPKQQAPKVQHSLEEVNSQNQKSADVMANILSRLTALGPENMIPIPANQKNINDVKNAKNKIVPFFKNTILPTLTGEEQDYYEKIIDAFNAKWSSLTTV